MLSITTLYNRIGDILMLSLRPAQMMLSTSALIMAMILFMEGGQLVQPYTIHTHLNPYIASSLFLVYGCVTMYLVLAIQQSTILKAIRYATALTGLVLWSSALVLELIMNPVPSTVLHVMPILAEVWAIAQLMSKIREMDRRAL